jgi:hypothetical protein
MTGVAKEFRKLKNSTAMSWKPELFVKQIDAITSQVQ